MNIRSSQIQTTINQTKPNKKIRQALFAYKQAPIDYISPWNAQHHQNFVSFANLQSSKPMSMLSKDDQTMVQTFLEKIKETQIRPRKSSFKRNFSLDEQRVSPFKNRELATKLKNESNMVPKISNLKRNNTFHESQQNENSKFNQKSQNEDMCSRKRRYSFASKFSETKGSDNSITSKQPSPQRLRKFSLVSGPSVTKPIFEENDCNFDEKFNENEKQENNSDIKLKIKTQGEAQKQEEVLFVRRSKPKHKVTIISMNQTQPQLDQSQSMFMIKRHGKHLKQTKVIQKSDGIKTEVNLKNHQRYQLRSTMGMFPIRRIQTLTDKRRGQNGTSSSKDKLEMKKKYHFFDTFKQKRMVDHMQNIIQCHPELATTILIKR